MSASSAMKITPHNNQVLVNFSQVNLPRPSLGQPNNSLSIYWASTWVKYSSETGIIFVNKIGHNIDLMALEF